MAFYNRKMAKNKILTKAWKAGHQMELDESEEICLPDICDEIARRMRRSRRPRSRLSLRSFSVLLSGAVRLYRDQVDHLLRDTINYSPFNTPTTPKRLTIVDQELTSETSPSQSNVDQSKLAERNSDNRKSSYGDKERHRNDKVDKVPDLSDDESTVFTVTPNNQQRNFEEILEEKVEKRDQIIQTSSIAEAELNTGGFDPNLPFAYVIIHDSFHSRIPSKVLLSSLNKNVKFLPIRDPMN